MKKAARTVTTIMAFSALGITVTAPSASAEPLPTLRVLLSNQTHVSPRILARAQAETVRIYAEAGVDLVWVEPGQIKLGLLAFALTTIVITGTHVSRHDHTADLMGAAATTLEGGKIAYAFYDRIEHFARQKEFSAEQILGLVIAHELGHLLLGYGSHSSDGLMRREWERSDLYFMRIGRLTFTAQQAEVVRRKARILAAKTP